MLGKGRSKKGILEGNLQEGELEIGQVCANINDLKSAAQVVQDLVQEYQDVISLLKQG